MTLEELKADITNYCRLLYEDAKSHDKHDYYKEAPKLPYDTGLLTNQGWRLEVYDDHIDFIIDTDLCPYVEYIDNNPDYQTYGFVDRLFDYIEKKIIEAYS